MSPDKVSEEPKAKTSQVKGRKVPKSQEEAEKAYLKARAARRELRAKRRKERAERRARVVRDTSKEGS